MNYPHTWHRMDGPVWVVALPPTVSLCYRGRYLRRWLQWRICDAGGRQRAERESSLREGGDQEMAAEKEKRFLAPFLMLDPDCLMSLCCIWKCPGENAVYRWSDTTLAALTTVTLASHAVLLLDASNWTRTRRNSILLLWVRVSRQPLQRWSGKGQDLVSARAGPPLSRPCLSKMPGLGMVVRTPGSTASATWGGRGMAGETDHVVCWAQPLWEPPSSCFINWCCLVLKNEFMDKLE